MSGSGFGFGFVVVSNRGPFTLEIGPGGTVEPRPAAGGLAPSLSGALAEEGMAPGGRALWVASALSEADRLHATDAAVATGQDSLELRTVAVTPELGRAAYDVISNGTMWFLQHGLFDHSRRRRFDRLWYEAWEAYCQFNEAFADVIAEEAAAGAVVVVNDYHLTLVGRYLAKRRPDVATAYFTHTPFCPPEDLAMLPDGPRVELMESMASYGACGFHTAVAGRILRCASSVGVAAPATFVAPLAADTARLDEVAATEACRSRLAALDDELDGRTLVLRSDRVELSKNLIRGFLRVRRAARGCARMAGAGRLRGPRLLVARIAPGVPRLPGRDRAPWSPG